MLENIKSPSDTKSLGDNELAALASEIRETIIATVAKNGGHLASNLGMVEATLALHRVFDSPNDKIIFDVGHQCYAHKLLTGRYDKFHTLRSFGGISGFTSPEESEHDILVEGHSGSSVSAALGIATANKLAKNGSCTVAVVGDGALTNGMIYEALNNCADKDLDLVILINDNEMSISQNVGGLHNYLSRLRTSNGYFTFKRKFEHYLSAIPLIGFPIARFFKLGKDAIKRFFLKDTMFEDLGLIYLGPVNGHDMEKLTRVLKEAKSKHRCSVVHIRTVKGYGYAPAEAHPERYHSVGSFDAETGETLSPKTADFSAKMGEILCHLAETDTSICAVTAAMRDGTGLTGFAEKFPERFFDVGIAEEHAVTFASGLAAAGMKPCVALYSTFAQRVYDQILHDVSLQKLPMVLLLDRAGIVPGDGVTHQGIFDYAMFSAIPGVTIYSPENYGELEAAAKRAFGEDGLTILRYPKGGETIGDGEIMSENGAYTFTEGICERETVIVTYGRMGALARKCAKKCDAGVIKLLRIHPIDIDTMASLTRSAKLVYIIDEGIRDGGIGEKLCAMLACGEHPPKVKVKAIDGYLPHGTVSELMHLAGFTADTILKEIAEARRESARGELRIGV